VRTREGRPVKLEGNPQHPVNRGALCARGQSGIGRTYHPDRFTQPAKREGDALVPISWDEAIGLLAEKLRGAGGGTVMVGSDPGPTAAGLIDRWLAAVGAQPRVVYEPFAPESLREAAKAAFGVDSEPVFDLSGADLVVSLGADAFETWGSPTAHAREWAAARDVATHANGGARFVYVGPRLSMTASNADEWIAAKPGTEGVLALALARVVATARGAAGGLGGLLDGVDAARAATTTGVDAMTIERLGRGLAAA
jgi:molybdopterin-containing oxidoreductase family iron-sulfur binding subunit